MNMCMFAYYFKCRSGIKNNKMSFRSIYFNQSTLKVHNGVYKTIHQYILPIDVQHFILSAYPHNKDGRQNQNTLNLFRILHKTINIITISEFYIECYIVLHIQHNSTNNQYGNMELFKLRGHYVLFFINILCCVHCNEITGKIIILFNVLINKLLFGAYVNIYSVRHGKD